MQAPAAPLPLSDGDREILTRLARSQTAQHRQVLRARVLLSAGEGVANAWIAEQVGVSVTTVRAWRSRFVSDGVATLGKVADGRGRKPVLPKEKIDEIVTLTRNSPPTGGPHWSVRTMARKVGVSPATVQRIWAARGLKPHLVTPVKAITLSTEPRFEEKSDRRGREAFGSTG